MKLMKRYQKRYCVIHNGIFYYFENTSSKKQNGAFTLSGRSMIDFSSKLPASDGNFLPSFISTSAGFKA